MINRLLNNLKHTLIPCFVLSAITGIFTGTLIFFFKYCASYVISLSVSIYKAVNAKPIFLPLLILGMAVLGLLSHFILKFASECKGGGIPTALTIIRGFVSFKWLLSAFVLPISALITFFSGVPLGNEGPSVQMGCAVGKGSVDLLAKKNKAWDKYIMTGGACAGFAAATGAPLSGLLFSIEEIHRRFSPLIFMSVGTATIASTMMMKLLGNAFNMGTSLFHLHITEVLPMKYIPAAIAVGIIAGLVCRKLIVQQKQGTFKCRYTINSFNRLEFKS
jgi:H+/Cl- antiporter ClcA